MIVSEADQLEAEYEVKAQAGKGICTRSEVLFFYFLLAVPGHALLWLSLVKWKRKKRESARF
jgi:hypothetical protein